MIRSFSDFVIVAGLVILYSSIACRDWLALQRNKVKGTIRYFLWMNVGATLGYFVYLTFSGALARCLK